MYLNKKLTSSILYSEDIIYAAVYLFLTHVQMLILKSLLAITFFWAILKLSFSITQEHIHNKTPISISSFHLTSICVCAHMVVCSVWMWCMLTSMHVYVCVCNVVNIGGTYVQVCRFVCLCVCMQRPENDTGSFSMALCIPVLRQCLSMERKLGRLVSQWVPGPCPSAPSAVAGMPKHALLLFFFPSCAYARIVPVYGGHKLVFLDHSLLCSGRVSYLNPEFTYTQSGLTTCLGDFMSTFSSGIEVGHLHGFWESELQSLCINSKYFGLELISGFLT